MQRTEKRMCVNVATPLQEATLVLFGILNRLEAPHGRQLQLGRHRQWPLRFLSPLQSMSGA